MSERSFQQKQFEFARHIRDPENAPIPEGIEARRMKIYRDLFYKNIEGFISGGFPVLHSITDDEQWHAMVRDFMVRHRCETPYFLEITQEFLDYLENERVNPGNDYPFLFELAHYEWVELALMVSDDVPDMTGVNPVADLIDHPVQVSPLVWNLQYTFPVQHIGEAYLPQSAPEKPTHIAVYRDRQNEVQFMELNSLTALLLDKLQQESERTVGDIVSELHEMLPQLPLEQFVAGARKTMDEFLRRDIVLGARVG
jgi:hypothetical protein